MAAAIYIIFHRVIFTQVQVVQRRRTVRYILQITKRLIYLVYMYITQILLEESFG